ncbi:MAG TPA: hypothetical protein VMR81_03390 [Patescibacteria group bacterium]|nr:hypothetical protein [Patescibacteria group bacterium]
MDNDRDLLLISVFTFFTVCLWITFELLKTVKTTTVSATTQQIIIPLSSKIDVDTLSAIANKKVY